MEEEERRVYEGFLRFNTLLNEPVNTINIEDLLDENLNFAGTAFRQVLEKIIFKIYDNRINRSNTYKTLATAISKLEENRTIKKKLVRKLHAVRIYGNDNTHYSEQTTTRAEALVAAMNLLSIMEELEPLYLEMPNDTNN